MIKTVRIIAILFGNKFNELAHTPKGIWSSIQMRLQFSMLGLVAHGGILPYESRTDMNACKGLLLVIKTQNLILNTINQKRIKPHDT